MDPGADEAARVDWIARKAAELMDMDDGQPLVPRQEGEPPGDAMKKLFMVPTVGLSSASTSNSTSTRARG